MSGNVTARMKLFCGRFRSTFLKRQQRDVTDAVSSPPIYEPYLSTLLSRNFERHLLA